MKPNSEQVDVCISGGGIAGLVMALSLAKTGVSVLVAEKGPAINTNGADVLKPSGIDVLEKLGLMPALIAAEARRRQHVEIYHNGQQLAVMNYQTHNDRPYFYLAPYQVVVGAVLEALTPFPNVRVCLNTAITDINVSSNGHIDEVRLSTGRLVRASLYVGADGLQSTLRSGLGIDAQIQPYAQAMFFRQLPLVPSVDAMNRLYVDDQFGLAYFYPINHRFFRAVIGMPMAESAPFRKPGSAQLLRDRLHSFVTQSDDALAILGELSDYQTFPLCRMHIGQYTKGNAVLLGNAAHAIHPISGQGMNLAIEDAGVLSNKLHQYFNGTTSLETALADYEQERRYVNEKVVTYADKLATSLNDADRFAACLNLNVQTSGRNAHHLELV